MISLVFEYMPYVLPGSFPIDFHLWIRGDPACTLHFFVNCEFCVNATNTFTPSSSAADIMFPDIQKYANVTQNSTITLRATGQGCNIDVWYPRLVARAPGITSVNSNQIKVISNQGAITRPIWKCT